MTDTTDSGATSESTTEFKTVEVHELSDDELKSVKEGSVESIDDDAEAVDGETLDNQADESQKFVSREEYEKLLADSQKRDQFLEQRQQHIKNLERFVSQRNNEIGQLRKEKAELILASRRRLDEQILTEDEAFEERFALKEAEKEFHSLTEEQENLTERFETARAVTNFFPEDLPINDMVSMLKGDGLDDESLREFVQDPYSVGEAALINMALRAKERQSAGMTIKKLFTVASQAIEALKHAEQNPSQAKREVLKGLNKAMKDTSYLNGTTGGSRGNAQIADQDVTKMSDEELKRFLDSAR
jgi:hypothetical protein